MRMIAVHSLLALALCMARPVAAAPVWHWAYQGQGLRAEGRLTTTARPDARGFYRVTSISGRRNGVAITRLVPAGRPIPGNAPYPVDNLLRPGRNGLTEAGLGYALVNGSHASPFRKTHDRRTLEYLAAPRQRTGTGVEVPIRFMARRLR
jgi:hypothetical protein